MDVLDREQQRVGGHPYALEVGSYFLSGYYNILANTPDLAKQFYNKSSTVVRLDCQTMESSFGETLEEINEMLMSMNVHKVEVKTANCLESWGGAIFVLVTGLVQLKGQPSRKRFSQSFLLAPQIKPDGFFVCSDIFKLICDEYDDRYRVTEYNYADNISQMAAHNTTTETAYGYVAEELETERFAAPADTKDRDGGIIYENHEMQQQDPLEFEAAINEDTRFEDPAPTLDALAPSHPPSPPTPQEEPVGEPPKQTYASVLRTKLDAGHQVVQPIPHNKSTTGTAESQVAQVVPIQEKSNLDTRRDVSTPEDEEEFLSVYVGNLSPSTSVFDLEKVFQAFGRIKPDGVAIRSRKEAGAFFGFVEYEDMGGIHNALSYEIEKIFTESPKLHRNIVRSSVYNQNHMFKNFDPFSPDASPIELNGRLVHVEERRPNSGVSRGGRRGRGRTADFSRGGRYEGDYATRSKGNGYQRRGGRQYDGYD